MGEETIKVAVDGQNKEMSITDVCELLNLSLEDLIKNKKDNSWEVVISDTKPSCYINILGQLVISEEIIQRVNRQREKKAAMEKYMVKSRALGRCDIEMEYDEYSDEIHVFYMKKRNDGDIRIPDYVDYIRLSAWNDDCEGCTIYIPAGCDIEIEEDSRDDFFNISGTYGYHWGITEYAKCVIVEKKHKSLSSKNGVLFNKDKTELLAYPGCKENKTYTIPDSVSFINECSFWRNHNLKKINVNKKAITEDFEDMCSCTHIKMNIK